MVVFLNPEATMLTQKKNFVVDKLGLRIPILETNQKYELTFSCWFFTENSFSRKAAEKLQKIDKNRILLLSRFCLENWY